MAAETEFHMTSADLNKRSIQLRAFIDQAAVDGSFSPDDENSLLEQVFTADELEWIEEHEEKLHNALQRVEEDYGKVVDASVALHASQDAVDAHIVVLSVEEAEEELAAEDAAEDGDEDSGDDDEDPDADLDGDE